jgi:hypothetical protein
MSQEPANNTQGLVIHDSFTIAEQNQSSAEGEQFYAGLTAEIVARFYAKVRQGSGCWMWTGSCTPKGYGQFSGGRFADGRQDTRYAHRTMWELTHGRRLRDGEVIRHACDVPRCVNPSHLLIGTQADNVNDAKVQGKYRTAARRRWHNPDRHRLVQSLLTAPRGTLTRVAAEQGIAYSTLAVAVCRARKAVTHG